MSDSYVDLRLNKIGRVYASPRADFLAALAADSDISDFAAERAAREAEALYRRARAFAPRAGTANVRAAVVDVLRRLGG
jgi:hypothetical protein